MKEITSIHELDQAEEKAWKDTVAGDLLLIKQAIQVIDGYIVIISADSICNMKDSIYYITNENFNQWTEGNKKYFKEEYNA